MIVKIDPRSQKQNGGMDQEDKRNLQQRPRAAKEQTEMNKKITEMKNTLEKNNIRITEAEEWVSELEANCRNFFCGTE